MPEACAAPRSPTSQPPRPAPPHAPAGDAVAAAVGELSALGGGSVHGMPCNVARPNQLAALADFAKAQMGTVDMWINNAGTNAYRVGPLASQDNEDIISIIETNVIGVMLGCKEAIRVMKDQPSGGHIVSDPPRTLSLLCMLSMLCGDAVEHARACRDVRLPACLPGAVAGLGQAWGRGQFNMDGAGADGNATPRFAAYGATKRGLAQLGKSLQ
ncbi:hypothetical protein CHLNCDRAFT_55778, partial [Chlorella variabilis]